MLQKIAWFVQAQAWNYLAIVKRAFPSKEQFTFNLLKPLRPWSETLMKSEYPEIPVGPLKVPRAFGDDSAIQSRIMENMKLSCQLTQSSAIRGEHRLNLDLGSDAWDNIYRWTVNCDKPLDGGDFTDIFIARGAGDTPIAICEHFTNLVFAAHLVDRYAPLEEHSRFNYWLNKFAYYVRDYGTAQNNNHLVWKALFLLASGSYLQDTTLYQDGLFHFRKAMTQIRHDGALPLELAREHLASSYTRMWIEGMLQCVRIIKNNDDLRFQDSEILIKTLVCFKECVTDNAAWCKKYSSFINTKKAQRLPENPAGWDWIFALGTHVFGDNAPSIPSRSENVQFKDALKDAYVTMYV